jgi:hypothetical protein
MEQAGDLGASRWNWWLSYLVGGCLEGMTPFWDYMDSFFECS